MLPAMDPLVSSFRTLALESPEAPAAVGPAGGWTRSALRERAERLGAEWGRALVARGLGPGAVVALRSEAGAGFLAAFLACRLAGACVLLLDAKLTSEEERRVSVALGAAASWSSEAALAAGGLEDGDVEWLPGRAALPEAACLKLTSGSSGEPAGVITPASSLLADGHALVRSIGLRPADRLLVAVPLSHSYGLSVLASPAWLIGCPLVLPAGEDLLEVAAEFGATFLPSVPSWFEARLRAQGRAPLPPSLRSFMSAGAPLRAATAREWLDRHGLPIQVLYGSSECGGITYDRVGDAAVAGSVGTPVEGVRVELDEAGQVTVHSEATALGYWPPDPERGARLGPGWFRTEDVGRWEDGRLVLEGRRSQWINVKGNKVNPLEVEAALEGHPAVRDVVVIGRPLPAGHGEAVRAIIACEDGALSFREIVAWCRPRLARHKYPRSVEFVRELPRNERGKLDRRALRAL